jgi:hypothetical protein
MSETVDLRNLGLDVPVIDEFVQYYANNGVDFRSADILCFGSTGADKRLALLVSALSRHDDTLSQISRFLVVLQPDDRGGTVAEDRLTLEIEAALARENELSGNSKKSVITRDCFLIARSPDLRIQSLLTIIRNAEPQSVVIVREAAEYRAEGVSPFTNNEASLPTLPEDLWVPHLHALAKAVMQVIEATGVSVVLDTGRLPPYRKQLRELLESVEGCGVLGARIDDAPFAVLASRVDQWDAWLSAGRLGAVLKDIDSLPAALNADKPFLRIQLLHRAGLHGQALAAIEDELQISADASPFSSVKLARIAADAGSSVLAARLLRPAIDDLTSREGLQLALATAADINNSELWDQVAARLQAMFPDSPSLSRHRAAALISSRNYRDAATALANVPGSEELSNLYKLLAECLTEDGVPNYVSALEQVTSLKPHQSTRARAMCVQDALSRGLLVHAFTLANAGETSEDLARRTVAQLIEVTERLFLSRDSTGNTAVGLEDIKLAVINIVKYLSRNPADSEIRMRLADLLSIQVSGSIGLALIAEATLDLTQREISLRDKEVSRGFSPEELLARRPFLTAAFAWLAAEAPVVLGRVVLPEELLTEPAEEIVPAIMQLVEYFGRKLDDDSDVKNLMNWVMLGTAIVPHTSDRDQDIAMIQVAASRFVRVGRVQIARDWAQQVLEQSGTTARRNRLSWFAVADIYHRLGNTLESFIALACGFASDGEVGKQHVLNETTDLVRLLRDLRLMDLARQALKTGHELVHRLGLGEQHRLRLETHELQLVMLEFLSKPVRSREELHQLLEEIAVNGRAVLAGGDDPGPAAMMLGQLLPTAANMGVNPEPNVTETLETLLEAADPTTASLVKAMSAHHPTAAQVLAVLKNLETARYSEDVAFDVFTVVLMARRLLAGKEVAADPEIAAFAIELLADRAIAAPGWESTAAPVPAPTAVGEPWTIARAVSLDGVSVVILGLDADSRLVRVAATAGQLQNIARENESIFSSARLHSWAKEFPYRYGVDENTLNLFYTSTEGLGLSDLPEGRVLFVTDAKLQLLPPNLLRVDGQFAGQSRPVAAAPSLSWLAAARQRAIGGNGRLSAWIPRGDGGQTLDMIADRLGPTFEEHGFDIDRSSTLPEGLAGSEFAVIAAHGSIVPEGRYFQLISDDAARRIAASDLAGELRNIGVVILFVCSGGRADKHPSSNTIVGLAKQLLDRGCSAVVASPWPLDARVTYHWLPEFLKAWGGGAPLIDANFAANKAVALGLGDDLARCLAMSVYGDPLRVKAS